MSKYKTQSVENYMMLIWMDKYIQGHNGFIAGGCFKNIFNGERIKDIDIFFPSETDFYNAVNHYDRQSAGYSDSDKMDEKYNFYYQNDRVKAYKDINNGMIIELCRSIFGTPKQVLKQFDFSITKFAYYKEKNDESTEYKVVYNSGYFEHLHMKRLVTDEGIPFPMATYERMIRYAKYGYFPCRETKLNIAKAINQLDEREMLVPESLYDGFD